MDLLLDARRVMFEAFFDFPVGSDGVAAAVARYSDALRSDERWSAGTLVCPSSRLEELAAVLTSGMPGGSQWAITVRCDEPLGVAAMHANVFHRYVEPAARVVAIQAHVDDVAELATAASGVAPGVKSLALATGGVVGPADLTGTGVGLCITIAADTPEAEVLRLIRASVVNRVPFTVSHEAGRLGAINLVAAASLAPTEERAVLQAVLGAPAAEFTTSAVGLRWHDSVVGIPQLREMRKLFMTYAGGGPSPLSPVPH